MATTFYNLLKLPLIFFLYLLPSAHSVYFQMPPFESNTSNIIYHGDAVPSIRAIEMNKVNFLCHVGWATYFERVPLWDYSENLSADFTARFSFIIDTQAVLIMVMGLHSSWLCWAGDPTKFCWWLSGLFNTTNSDSSHNQIVHVEFGSFVN